MIAVLAAVGITLGVGASVSTVYFPLSARRVDLGAGANLYASNCASCHQLTGDGKKGLGPNLSGLRDRFLARDGTHQTFEQYVVESIADPNAFRSSESYGQMPADFLSRLTDQELTNVSAYVCSASGPVDYQALFAEIAQIKRNTTKQSIALRLSTIERGKQLFYGVAKCSECHAVDMAGPSDLLAPNLATAGLQSREYLLNQIKNPNAHISPNYQEWNVLTDDGKVVIGQLLKETDNSLLILQQPTDGGIRLLELDKANIEQTDDGSFAELSPQSRMPNYAGQLSEKDLSALVDFLMTLR